MLSSTNLAIFELKTIVINSKDEIECLKSINDKLENLDLEKQYITSYGKHYFQFFIDQENPIAAAAKKTYWLVVKELIPHFLYKNDNKLDERGYALIHYTCYLGMKEAFQQLLLQKVDINTKSSIKDTPLIQAVKGGYLSMVELVVDQPGCDLELDSESGPALVKAANDMKWSIARIIVEKLPPSNHLDKRGYRLIQYAAYLGMFAKVKELYEKFHETGSKNLEKILYQADLGLKSKPVNNGEYNKIFNYFKPKPVAPKCIELKEKIFHPTRLTMRKSFKFSE